MSQKNIRGVRVKGNQAASPTEGDKPVLMIISVPELETVICLLSIMCEIGEVLRGSHTQILK